jgi:hypothetical protein
MGVAHARQLANYIANLEGFVVRPRTGANYDHMGAIICDSILQAGLNYATVVAPRVRQLMARWPTARRTSAFASMSKRLGLASVLNWRDPEKPRRIVELTAFFAGERIETEHELRNWLTIAGHAETLLSVRGVGPKTIDYIKSLVGVQTVAVDRHVRAFVERAGLRLRTYEDVRTVTCAAADILGHEYCALDHAIWSYVSQGRRSRAA